MFTAFCLEGKKQVTKQCESKLQIRIHRINDSFFFLIFFFFFKEVVNMSRKEKSLEIYMKITSYYLWIMLHISIFFFLILSSKNFLTIL